MLTLLSLSLLGSPGHFCMVWPLEKKHKKSYVWHKNFSKCQLIKHKKPKYFQQIILARDIQAVLYQKCNCTNHVATTSLSHILTYSIGPGIKSKE